VQIDIWAISIRLLFIYWPLCGKLNSDTVYSKKQEILLEDFVRLSDKLFDYGVITTDSFTGEIGEYYACRAYNLSKTPRVTRAVDGISKSGKKYQVKSKFDSKSFSYSIQKLEPNLFDYLVIVYFDEKYDPIKIIRTPSNKIIDKSFRITKNNLSEFEEFDISRLSLKPPIKNTINDFAKTYLDLEKNQIIRSKRIVGDIGEFYASKRLNLSLSENKNEKGIDAYNYSGLTFEIKTRRVYESGRRNSNARRINGLKGKSADFLIVVTLDKSFKCSGMWIMPMKNIINPKSAKLQIVNTTLGTRNLIKSKISWLDSGKTFIDFEEIKSFSKRVKTKISPKKFQTSNNPDIHEYISFQKKLEKDFKDIDKGCLFVAAMIGLIILFFVILEYLMS
jgi:hypothetical protein